MSEQLSTEDFERLLRRVAAMFARSSWATDALMQTEKGRAVSKMVYRDWKHVPFHRLDDAVTYFVRAGARTPTAAEVFQRAAGADYANDPESQRSRDEYCASRGHTLGLDADTFLEEARSVSAGSPRGYVTPTCSVCYNAPPVTAEHAWQKWALGEWAERGVPGWPETLPADCRSDYESQDTLI